MSQHPPPPPTSDPQAPLEGELLAALSPESDALGGPAQEDLVPSDGILTLSGGEGEADASLASDFTQPLAEDEGQDVFVDTPSGEPIQVAGLSSVVARAISRGLSELAPISLEAGAKALERQDAILRSLGERTGEALPTKAININFQYLDGPDKVNELIEVLSVQLRDVAQKSRRGKRSAETTAEAARELGLTTKELLQRKPGEAWNAETLLAARYVLADSRNRLDVLTEAILRGEAGPNLQIDFSHQLAVHAGIQAQIHGLAAEAGRALNQFRQMAMGGQLDDAAGMLRIQAERGLSPENLAMLWKAAASNPKAQDLFARAAYRATGMDMLREIYTSSLLSAFSTQAVNILGNSMNAVWLPMERTIAGSIGVLTRSGGVAGLEGVAMVYGQVSSIKAAWKYLAFTARNEASLGELANYSKAQAREISALGKADVTGDPTMGLSKLEGRQQAITSENVAGLITRARDRGKRWLGASEADLVDANQIKIAGPIAAGIDALGKIIRLSFRGLQSADEFFKTIAFHGELGALAYRQAVGENLRGLAAAQRMVQIAEGMPDNLMTKANAFAHYATFTEELINPLGKAAQTAARGGAWIITPFVRTPANLLDYSTERVLAPFKTKWRDQLLSDDPAIRDQALAKLGAGVLAWTGVMLTIAENYECGAKQQVCLTGAGPPPADKAGRAAFRRLGLQEYSLGFLMADGTRKWYSYNRADPMGQMIGIAADIVQIFQRSTAGGTDAELLASAAVAAVSNNIVNKTYMQGMAETLEVMTSKDPNQFKRVMGKLASGFVPFGSFIASAERTVDPVSRQVRADLSLLQVIVDRVKSRTPGLSKELLPYRNVWGEPQYLNTALNFAMISPIYVTFERSGQAGKLDRELMKLRVPVNLPPRQIFGVPLNPVEHDRYVQLAGNALKASEGAIQTLPINPRSPQPVFEIGGLGFHEALVKLSASEWWKTATSSVDPPGMKVTAVRALQGRYRAQAKDRMVYEFPTLISSIRESLQTEQRELTGMPDGVTGAQAEGQVIDLLNRAQRAGEMDAPEIKIK